MNLYWVDNAIFKLYDKYIDPDTGEIMDADAFAEEYAALQISREEVIENTLLMYKNASSDVAAIAEEIKQLTARKTVLEKRAERYKADAAKALDGEKYSSPRVTVSYRKSTAVEVDETLCPAEYIVSKVTTSPDKKAITAAIKAGNEVAGCKLVERLNMQIK